MLLVSVYAALNSEKVKPVSGSTYETASARGENLEDGKADAKFHVSEVFAQWRHTNSPTVARATSPKENFMMFDGPNCDTVYWMGEI